MSETVNYFGYGSNMLYDRLKFSAPGATLQGIAKLEDHEVDYGIFNEKWNGYMTQMVPRPGKVIWGAIWRMSPEEKQEIFRQEGVNKGVLKSKDVNVTTPDGSTVQCFLVYRDAPPAPPSEGARWSITYKNVTIQGAKACGLPQDYIAWLESWPHNGKEANFDYSKDENW